ncbi:MAG: class I SAM-dependent methyltransferase [Betaproteobacteria bacterium]
MTAHIQNLIDAASRPYLVAGRYAYYFARSKLTHDPVFISLLRSGRIPDRARILDLGCGHAVLASLLLAAHKKLEDGLWPADWKRPPSGLQLHGIESLRATARRAQITLGERASILLADLRDASLPDADVVVLIDVLHYLTTDDQIALLRRVSHCLRGGGVLVLRVADTNAGWRFRAGMAADLLGSVMSTGMLLAQHHRSIGEWIQLLAELGFEPSVEPVAKEKSFANVVLWATSKGPVRN